MIAGPTADCWLLFITARESGGSAPLDANPLYKASHEHEHSELGTSEFNPGAFFAIEELTGGSSSTVYEENILQCNPNTYYCSAGVTINDVPGNKVGETQSGVRTLIHRGVGNQSEGTDSGQDTITWQNGGTPSFDYTITGGSLNPISGLQGQTRNSSDSIIIVPLTTDQPPPDGQLSVNITGFLDRKSVV